MIDNGLPWDPQSYPIMRRIVQSMKVSNLSQHLLNRLPPPFIGNFISVILDRKDDIKSFPLLSGKGMDVHTHLCFVPIR